MIRILRKVDTLKRTPFPNWPVSIQRIFLISIGVLLFLIINKIFFNMFEKKSLLYKKNTHELTHEIQVRQKVIQESTLYLQRKNKDTLSVPDFLAKFSGSSKKNHLTVQTIKPLVFAKKEENNTGPMVQSFQISVTGEYTNLLKLMRNTLLGDFQIKSTGIKNSLKLTAVVNLYFKELL